jgi:hypothetical protein
MTSPSRGDPALGRFPQAALADGARADTAVADAAAVLERTEHDERAATDARQRYRAGGIAPVAAAEPLLPHLADGEQMLAMRTNSLLEDCGPSERSDSPRTGGALYLTNRRILQLGRSCTSIDLRLIEELALAGERLLLTLRDGRGFAIDLPEPRLFRVQIAAALRAGRS